MTTAPHDIAEIVSYHAHIYFDSAAQRQIAGELREQISERFSVQVGRWHDVNVEREMIHEMNEDGQPAWEDDIFHPGF